MVHVNLIERENALDVRPMESIQNVKCNIENNSDSCAGCQQVDNVMVCKKFINPCGTYWISFSGQNALQTLIISKQRGTSNLLNT